MARPELGEKHICAECKMKYYDLNRSPIICPKCGAELEESRPEEAENEFETTASTAGGADAGDAIAASTATTASGAGAASTATTASGAGAASTSGTASGASAEDEMEAPIDRHEEGPEFISLDDAAESEEAEQMQNEDHIPEDIPEMDIEDVGQENSETETFLDDEEEGNNNITDILGVPDDEKEEL